MDVSPKGLTRYLGRLGAAAQNTLEIARFGGLDTGEEPSPYQVVDTQPVYRLRHYFPDRAGDAGNRESETGGRPAVVLVPPLMVASEVYDVSPATSAVALLAARGIDPWVVDFGAPERETGGLTRTLTDHVLAVSDAVDRVTQITGRAIHLGGYSQGGMFCYQAAAYRNNAGIVSLITFGSPVDTWGMIPFGLPEEFVARTVGVLADTIAPRLSLPAWAVGLGFRLLDPVKSLRQRVDFLRQLHDRQALLPREGQRRFLAGEGWVAYPGPALAELLKQFVAQNRMLSGGFVIDDRLVTLADVASPVLTFVGEVDEIAPPAAVRAIVLAAPRAEVYEKTLRAGHFGLVVGSHATNTTWPTVAAWARWIDSGGDPDGEPGDIQRVSDYTEAADSNVNIVDRVGHAVGLAAQVGVGATRSAVTVAGRGVGALRELAQEAIEQLPRLNRLEFMTPTTRVSVGLVLDEQAAVKPDGVFFLFGGQAYSYGAAKMRVDAIVRGLISVGIRQGEHVGVLMGTRPTALALVAALNRLGAVVVMMRPDSSPRLQAELGQIARIIADPEHADAARDAGAGPVLVLGGVGAAPDRRLDPGLIDMERIDPDEVPIPAWYDPNPGRAGDLAFILFSGQDEHIAVNRITNRRWAVSAFGTASAAALSAADTVYSVTPLYHASALLTSIGGAIAGGSRLALATHFDPDTFWDEVRRYGVTVVSYVWTLLRSVVDAPPTPSERHHPVRLLAGSGMPVGVWRRAVARFGSTTVLEFYASTEGEAVLANVSGAKVGSRGRPLPGSAEVRIAAYDVDEGRLVEGPDGLAVECPPGEVGMLLARARFDQRGLLGSPLRGVFAKGDAWHLTGDLFRRDRDGDFWWEDAASSVIRTAKGPVNSVPIEDALGTLDAVDLAVAYGVPEDGGEAVVAAVTLLPGREVSDGEMSAALAGLDERRRPVMIRLVDEIPLTTWYRPLKAPLRKEGLPEGARGWRWDDEAGSYVR